MNTNQQPAIVSRTILDPVKKDGVLKEQVERENETRKTWQNKWNFMYDFYQFCVEEAKKEGFTEEEYKKLQSKKKARYEPKLHGWEFCPSEKLPPTSSGMIGWRSSRKECSLERFGLLYESERFSISPPDRPPTPPQKYIFLG